MPWAHTTKCCSCNRQIARDAKTCPQCGSQKPHKYAWDHPRTILAFLVIIGIPLYLATTSHDVDSSSNSDPAPSSKPTPEGLGIDVLNEPSDDPEVDEEKKREELRKALAED